MIGLPEIVLLLVALIVVPAVIVVVVILVVRAVRRPAPVVETRGAEVVRGPATSPPVESASSPVSPSNGQDCPRCGGPLAAGSAARGLCPKCLMEVGMGTQAGEGSSPAAKPAVRAPSVTELAGHFPSLEILEILGQGGMGMVYKARQRALDRWVALKVLPQDAARDPAFAERFQREARALARLSHPNIVGVYEFGETAGYFYLVMEYVDGADLRRVLQQRKLSAEEALRIVPAICDALQYAHANGVVHRDIKPGNILLDREGRVKIADFGIAKLVGGESLDPTLTQLRQRMGTPHYMAPEQVENPQAVDHRADIFSLGVVFYEMLTGELPLGRFPAPSSKVQVDVRLDEVVLRALEKEPARRYQQAGEVKTEVERISGDPGGGLVRREGKAPRARWGAMKKAVAGWIWAGILFPFFLLALWMLGRGGGGTSEDVSTILFLGLVVICGLAPVGTTVLGLLAIRDAYRERIGGLALGLSLGAAGLFPGLLVVLLVFGGWMLLIGLVFGGLGHILVPALALVASLATAGPLVVWFSTRIWRQANQRLTSLDAAAPRGRSRDRRWQPIVLVASQLLVCLILIGLLAAKTGHRRPTVFVNTAGDPVESATGLPLVSSVSIWEMTTNGPAVNDSLAWSMPGGLRDDQKSVLERELTDAWARYREMLAENSKILTNVHGHIEVELAMKPEELERLESSFWAEVDPHFDRAQQTFLRESIQFQPSSGLVPDRKTAPRMPGVPLLGGGSPLSAPSESEDSKLLLPMNGSLILEFWRVGRWYHWRSRSGSYNDGVPMDSLPITRGPEMPPELRPLVEIAETKVAASP